MKKDKDLKSSKTSWQEPLAVIGMGCMFPRADCLGAYWANIVNRVDSITEVPDTHWRAEDYSANGSTAPEGLFPSRGGFIPPVDFNPMEFGIPPNVLEAIDTSQLLGLVAAQQALDDAGYGPDREFDRERVSVILGVTGTLELTLPLGARLGHPIWRKCMREAGIEGPVAEDAVKRISDSYVSWQENSFPGLLGNVVAGRIAKYFNLGGTNCVVDAACASSLGAIHLAGMELASGRSHMVITGGIDTFNDVFMYTCFRESQALSPSGDARPFDVNADGTILGEGLGVLLLKRLEDAGRDGDRVYAVILSMGTSSDGKGQAIYAPSAAGQIHSLRQAYSLAGITADTIELVEAHGTGTRAGDAAELEALIEVYGAVSEKKTWCALGSVKSQIGHTKAAAGVAGIIKAAMALHHKVLPPTIKVTQPQEELTSTSSPFYINTEKRPWMPSEGHPRRAVVSSFGFGGSNFHCVLEEYDSEKPGVDWDGRVQIIAFSADTKEDLRRALLAWTVPLSWEELRDKAAQSRSTFSQEHHCRLLLVAEKDRADIPKSLANARAMLEKYPEKSSWDIPDGVYFGSGPVAGKLGIIFPGQGSQYVGMLKDLTCRFPQIHQVLAEANQAFATGKTGEQGQRLTDYIYPHPAFNQEVKESAESALRATQVTQPAIGAVSLGAFKVLDHFGTRPEALAGHSYGELTALCASGRIDPKTLHYLSMVRGQLMSEGNGDRGAMLAVQLPLSSVDTVIREENLNIIIANRNAPGQAVLSGLTEEIERAAQALNKRDIRSKRLPVSAAFHSSLVGHLEKPFLSILEQIEFSETGVPVFANSTTHEYPAEPEEVRRILAAQLVKPVEFVREIENMYRFGVRTFLEVGPGAKLTGLVKAILDGREHDALSVDATSGNRSGLLDLACSLSLLCATGHHLKLSLWDPDEGRKSVISNRETAPMTVPICGANYMKPKTAKPPLPHEFTAPAARAFNKDEPGTGKSHVMTTPRPIPPTDYDSLARALRTTQENIEYLQKIQEQTAQLHRKFLEGQDMAQRTVQALVEQQRELLQTSFGISSGTERMADPASRIDPEKVLFETDVVTPGQHIPPPQALFPPVQESAASTQPKPPGPTSTTDQVPALKSADSEKSPIGTILLDVVSEKTGYPVEMLELDMELDSDLGIDSIKRVEILSVIQERLPETPPVKPEHLGSLKTLRQIVEFLENGQHGTQPMPGVPRDPDVPLRESPGRILNMGAILLDVVSEKTGYPVEMLELDMELDSDLGIDSIKRVEILSVIQERLPETPPVKPEHLGSLKTLRQIVEFLSGPLSNSRKEGTATPWEQVSPKAALKEETSGQAAPASRDLDPGPEIEASLMCSGKGSAGFQLSDDHIERRVLSLVRLDQSMTRQSLSVCQGARIWITDEDSGLALMVKEMLETLDFQPELISFSDLKGMERPSDLGGLVILSPARNAGDAFLKNSFKLLRLVGAGLRNAGNNGGSVLVTVSRLDGSFGLTSLNGGNDPASGGLAGLLKTARQEWSEVHCKALDLSGDFKNVTEAASAIVDEMFLSGPLEVGLSDRGRYNLQLLSAPLKDLSHEAAVPIDKGDVVVITGGGRGVTAEVAVALSRAFKPTLILLGRSKAPTPEPAWLAPLTEEAEIKKALLERAGGKSSPGKIEEQYREIIANRELNRNIARLEAEGSRVIYRSVDIRDAKTVRSVIGEIRREVGPIKGLIHGAGVLADRLIEDKTDEQFDRVYSTKVAGLRALLQAMEPGDLKVMVLFSSSTGRYGRSGQVDYAAANEVLNKFAQQQARFMPHCRVISVNWGPWNGGMVSPSLRKIFEKEGVGLIDLEAGARYLVREICSNSDRPVEVVVMGRMSGEQLSGPAPSACRAGTDATSGQLSFSTSFELQLDISHFPFLESHVINGMAVLPMAIIIEWMAHGALHRNPGLKVVGFDNLRILKGLTVDKEKPPTIRVLAGKAVKKDSFRVVPVELCSAGENGRGYVHASVNIMLGTRFPEGNTFLTRTSLPPYPRQDEIYDTGLLFHGPHFQGIQQVEGCSDEGIEARVSTAPSPSRWIKRPLRNTWLADPLVLDSAFQMMILWCNEKRGVGALPCFVGRYRQFQPVFPRHGVKVVIQVTKDSEHRALADMEFVDPVTGELVARMEHYECVIDASLNCAFKCNRLARQNEVEAQA